MDALTQIVVSLNALANAVGRALLAPIAFMPGWLSATIVAALTGVVMLVMFKYTSNQKAIKAAHDDIKANLLALKLFKESMLVSFGAQGRILHGAMRLLVFSVVPMLVMALPVTMLLAQLSLWYQARPLRVGEEAIVALTLVGDASDAWPKVSLRKNDAVAVLVGPVRVSKNAAGKRELIWNLRMSADGLHRLVFQVDDNDIDKEITVGDGFKRVSTLRPSWSWADALLYPGESAFPPSSPVQSIEIVYPTRSSWIYGADSWVIYWFIVSLIAAFCCRKLVGVNI